MLLQQSFVSDASTNVHSAPGSVRAEVQVKQHIVDGTLFITLSFE